MALVRNWRIMKLGGTFMDIKKECKTMNLKGCKRITIKFDPFREDSKEIRDFSYLIYSFSASKTNPHAIIRTEVLADRSEPTVSVDLINGSKLLMKCSNLKVLELFQLLNKYVTPLAPQEEAPDSSKILKKGKSKFGK